MSEKALSTGELLELAQQYGTPCYVFDLEAFRARLRACQQIVGDQVALCFAMKANPFLVRAAAHELARLEVCSPGELAICERVGVAPAQIVYSGVNKQPADIAQAIGYGAGVLTAESLLHAEYLEQVAATRDVRVRVLLRLSAGSQFGMAREDLLWLVDHRARYPHLDFVGLHYFVGTQRAKLKRQRAELAMLRELCRELAAEHGWLPQRLEYGPGLPIAYFDVDPAADDLAPLRELAPDLQDVARDVELTVELGRFFAAPCGSYLTRAVDLKRNGDTRYAILDGGMHHINYFGQMMGLHVPPVRDLSREGCEDDPKTWCLCGSLCTVNDVLVRALELRGLERGDVLAFSRCGAYAVTEAPALFLSRTLPRVLLREGAGSVTLARDFVESSALNGAF